MGKETESVRLQGLGHGLVGRAGVQEVKLREAGRRVSGLCPPEHILLQRQEWKI